MAIRLSSLRTRIEPVAPLTIGAGLTAILVWSRLVGLDQSLWHDEIYSVVHYMSSPVDPFAKPYVPNNHVLFNVLSAATTAVLGQSELTVRLWSVVPGIASVIILGTWMTCRGMVWAGLATAGFLTLSPVHLELTRHARGYGLTFLAMSALVIFAVRATERPTVRELALVALSGMIGIFTLPVFVLPFIFTIAAMILAGLTLRLAALVVTSVGLGSLVWYSPVLTDLMASTSQEFGRQLTMADLLTQPVRLVEPTFRLVARHVPMWVWALLLVTLGALAALKLRRRLSLGPTILVLALVALGPYTSLLISRVHFEGRFASYQLIPIAILIVFGASTLLTTGPEFRRLLAAGFLAVGALLATATFVRHAALVASRPIEAFKEVGRVTNEIGSVPVVTNSVRPLGLIYYSGSTVMSLSSGALNEYLCHRGTPFIFIDHRYMTESVDTRCLLEREASLISFDQRTRGERIDVWIVSGTDGDARTAADGASSTR